MNETHGARTKARWTSAAPAILAAAILSTLLTPPAAPAAAAPAGERWYVLQIAGTPVGSVHEVAGGEGEELSLTLELRLVLNRMGSRVSMASSTTSRESEAGALLAVDHEMLVSSQATSFHAEVTPEAVRIRDRAGEASFDREIPYQGTLLGPEGARRRIVAELSDAGDRLVYRTFRAEVGDVVEVSLEVAGRETLVRDGREVESLKVIERLAELPIETTFWLDAEGRVIRSSVPSPFGVMETVLADAAAAELAATGGELPEESFAGTLVPTRVRLREPRRASRVVVELRHRNPALGWPELAAHNQAVLERSGDRLVLAVERSGADGVAGGAPAGGGLAPHPAASAYLQADAPAARELAARIVDGAAGPLAAARALERWVAENVDFDMGVVLAPSSEVLENRRGTCTEYAILLTTLARAAGLPARFVMGYVWVGGMYGGHAWTEVWIDGRWIGLDGAVIAEGPADAARFAFQWTSLAEGVGALSVGPAMQLYGQIEASILEYELDGEPAGRFDPEAPAFEIDGDLYRNPSLDMEWRKPEGYRFADTDLMWPETVLVAAEGPGGERAELRVRDRRYWLDEREAAAAALERELPGADPVAIEVGGRAGRLAATPNEAAVALVRGSELWVLHLEAEGADDRVRELAAALEL